VKDRLPFSVLFVPDRTGVVGTGLIFSFVGVFDRHLIGGNNCVGPGKREFSNR